MEEDGVAAPNEKPAIEQAKPKAQPAKPEADRPARRPFDDD